MLLGVGFGIGALWWFCFGDFRLRTVGSDCRGFYKLRFRLEQV